MNELDTVVYSMLGLYECSSIGRLVFLSVFALMALLFGLLVLVEGRRHDA